MKGEYTNSQRSNKDYLVSEQAARYMYKPEPEPDYLLFFYIGHLMGLNETIITVSTIIIPHETTNNLMVVWVLRACEQQYYM